METVFDGNALGLVRITIVGGKVSQAEIFEDGGSIQTGGRAVEIKHNFPEITLSLRIVGDSGTVPSAIDTLKNEIVSLHYLSLAGPDDYADLTLHIKSTAPWRGKLLTIDGHTVTAASGADVGEFVRRATSPLANAYIRKEFARVENRNSPFKVELWMEKDGKPVKNPEYEIDEVMVFKFKVAGLEGTNQKCYITLLDLQTSGSLNVLFPNRFMPSFDVEIGKEYTIPPESLQKQRLYIRLDGPPGRETVKIIASTKPLNITRIDPRELKGFGSIKNAVKFARDLVQNLYIGLSGDEAGKDLTLEMIPLEEALSSEIGRTIPTALWATDTMIVDVREKGVRSRDLLELGLFE